MECYEISNKEDALLLACHLLRDYRVEGFVEEDGTLILEFKTLDGQWFFVYKTLDIAPKELEVSTGHGDYYVGGPPESRILDSSLLSEGRGYWVNVQDPLFPVELSGVLYQILSDSPADSVFEIPDDWENQRHVLLFGGYHYPFDNSDWMRKRRTEIQSWVSNEEYRKLEELFYKKIDASGALYNELFDTVIRRVVRKAACTPRINKSKFKYLLRTELSERVAVHYANQTATEVDRIIGY